ncbi:MAG: oligosaccharide flippase family protein [Deferrisomatales bacterium]|nr:oligosaccharide flippase family protein [Deferrisomatales bacterium]
MKKIKDSAFKHLAGDHLFRRILKNSSFLLTGDAVGSGIRLICMALTARVLGVEFFGVLVLIQTYVGVVDRLINFQCWQAVIRFGASCVNEPDRFKKLIRYTVKVELATSAAATCLTILLSPAIVRWFGWEKAIIWMIVFYSPVTLFNLTGTSIGVLRLFDQYRRLGLQRIYSAVFKLAGILALVVFGGGIWGFLFVWMVTSVVEYLLLGWFAWITLRERGMGDFLRGDSSSSPPNDKSLFRFMVITNLHGSVRMSSREVDTLIVGWLIGDVAAGMYKVAKLFSLILSKLSDPIYEVVYPELARLVVEGRRKAMILLMGKSALLGGGLALSVWFTFYVFGSNIIHLTVGPEFLNVLGALLWYMGAIVLASAGLPLSPALLAMGRPALILCVDVGSTILYYCALFGFIMFGSLGIEGAGAAYLVYYVLWSLGMLACLVVLISRKNIHILDNA